MVEMDKSKDKSKIIRDNKGTCFTQMPLFFCVKKDRFALRAVKTRKSTRHYASTSSLVEIRWIEGPLFVRKFLLFGFCNSARKIELTGQIQ